MSQLSARLSVWLPARNGGNKAKVTGGRPEVSSGNEDWPMRASEEVFPLWGLV